MFVPDDEYRRLSGDAADPTVDELIRNGIADNNNTALWKALNNAQQSFL
jgi:hypothetical protein